MTWLSPAFPVGAFSYSSGIEWAVEAGDIVDAATLQDWLASMLADGPGFCDGVLLAHAHRAAACCDDAALREVAELAAAFAPSRERHLETSAQGRAFIEIARSAWSCDGLDRLIAACDGAIVYPVAVGIVSAGACDPAGIDDARLSARGDVELDFRRRTADPAGADRQPARAWRRWSRSSSQSENARSAPRWTISAARPFAPISPACGTRRSIRGCFGHECTSVATFNDVVPAKAGTHTPCDSYSA